MNSLNDSTPNQPMCVQSALRIIGDKWTAKILRDIAANIETFTALERSLEGISPRTLSQRLEMLQDESIIIKRQYCEHPPRFKYVLADKGTELLEVIQKMALWGGKYYSSEDELDTNLISTGSQGTI